MFVQEDEGERDSVKKEAIVPEDKFKQDELKVFA